MLGSAVPATATLHTSTSSATPISPTRPSRLRRLSYLRSYTHNHLHTHSTPSRPDAPPLTRSTSSPDGPTTSPPPEASRVNTTERSESRSTSGIQNGENGWLPTVQGRSGLSRDSLQPTSASTESAEPEPANSSISSMTRSRAATVLGPIPTTSSNGGLRRQSTTETSSTDPPFSTSSVPILEASSSSTVPPLKDGSNSMPTIRFIPHVETRSTRPSLLFTTMSRTLKTPTSIVRVGRYSERDNNNATSSTSHNPSTTDFLPVGFKSKVVSRRHCEFWCTAGQWYIKDVKSSSGTFLNHVRLSPPAQESRPYAVNDGDTVQLGIDFKGGEEVIFRCVKIRIECNRGWQKSLNAYNTTAHKRLLKNAGVLRKNKNKNPRDSDAASVNSSECSICLNSVAPCQALFVAPCSHVWHFKCVRNLIQGNGYPNFLCPNCRFVADLEADVEPPEEEEEEEEEESEVDGEGVDGDGEGVGVEEEGRGGGREEKGVSVRNAQEGSGEDEHLDSRRPERSTNSTDDELAGLLSTTSLTTPQPSQPLSLSHAQSPPAPSTSTPQLLADQLNTAPSTSTSTTTSTSASSQPVTIIHPPNQRSSSSDLLGARSTTPTSTTQFALAAGVVGGDGPMTPRNDAGPFVLDGSAGRDREGLGRGGGILERVVDGEGNGSDER